MLFIPYEVNIRLGLALITMAATFLSKSKVTGIRMPVKLDMYSRGDL
jgi:hypothetical protein